MRISWGCLAYKANKKDLLGHGEVESDLPNVIEYRSGIHASKIEIKLFAFKTLWNSIMIYRQIDRWIDIISTTMDL